MSWFKGLRFGKFMLSRRLRALCMSTILLAGLVSGAAIRPEEIEELIRAASKARTVQVIQDERVE